MPYTVSSAPPDVKRRFSGECLAVWVRVWNDTYKRHSDEGRAFATAETAGKRCKAAKAENLNGGMWLSADGSLNVMSGNTFTATTLTFPPPKETTAVDMAVKFEEGSDNVIRGLAFPFSKDRAGDDFGADTDLCLDWMPERPLLFHHGLDGTVKTERVGSVLTDSLEVTDEGAWVKAQLDKRLRWYSRVKRLVDEGAVSFSSGAMPHLVKTTKSGHIERWPWVELSLTPTPMHPGAVVYNVKSDLAPFAIEDIEEDDSEHESYTDHGQRVLAVTEGFLERTDDRAEARIKAGRELSAANLSVLKELDSHLAGWASDIAKKRQRIRDLIGRSDPEARKAIDELEVELVLSELRRSGVPI